MAFGGMVELARGEVRLPSCGKASLSVIQAVLVLAFPPSVTACSVALAGGLRLQTSRAPVVALFLITIKNVLLTRPGISP